ncbi:nitroreductase family deazaflavin-dependent oxidoreductase [Nakamurella leprariae]|uniref:Nitroreductase family deazaflavin-dependent oxidoreductase n=1 Tax=Nakamurella leprariae TaxID=2803911 RepID=A0A938YF70_9ACTN|nr:nitroreductase family deazaflavin-dependent oxidoreductase [Nakamurella leprariae]MBM9468426.1 nitroreductase family deazaflavin-dependent oxidoreductase [Nakamurella leprariae]
MRVGLRRLRELLVRALRHLIAPLSRTRAFRRVGPRVLPRLERLMDRVTGGRVPLSGLLVPSLVLHTTGSRTGTARQSVLMYTPDGVGGAVVAGTSFARDRHPAWSGNLLAHPDAAVSVRGRTFEVLAVPIGGDERDRAWARIERQWPGYRDYERNSGRTVRLFRLTAVDPEITFPAW